MTPRLVTPWGVLLPSIECVLPGGTVTGFSNPYSMSEFRSPTSRWMGLGAGVVRARRWEAPAPESSTWTAAELGSPRDLFHGETMACSVFTLSAQNLTLWFDFPQRVHTPATRRSLTMAAGTSSWAFSQLSKTCEYSLLALETRVLSSYRGAVIILLSDLALSGFASTWVLGFV